jgi:hypothetical protein
MPSRRHSQTVRPKIAESAEAEDVEVVWPTQLKPPPALPTPSPHLRQQQRDPAKRIVLRHYAIVPLQVGPQLVIVGTQEGAELGEGGPDAHHAIILFDGGEQSNTVSQNWAEPRVEMGAAEGQNGPSRG